MLVATLSTGILDPYASSLDASAVSMDYCSESISTSSSIQTMSRKQLYLSESISFQQKCLQTSCSKNWNCVSHKSAFKRVFQQTKSIRSRNSFERFPLSIPCWQFHSPKHFKKNTLALLTHHHHPPHVALLKTIPTWPSTALDLHVRC